MCYGVSDEDLKIEWICVVCQVFKQQDQYLRLKCCLCDQSGGAMRPTNLSSSDLAIFKRSIVGKRVDDRTTQFELHAKIQEFLTLDDALKKECSVTTAHHQTYREFYRGLLSKSKKLVKEKGPMETNLAWAHVNCGLWCSIRDDSLEVSSNLIFDFTLFDYSYAPLPCSICKSTTVTPKHQCKYKQCKEVFHPECLMRADFKLLHTCGELSDEECE